MEETRWYALGTSYCREQKLKAYFDGKGIETYVPMQYGFSEKDGKRKRVLKPAIHNLVFVKSTKEYIKSLKIITSGSSNAFRWLINPSTKEPITVPDNQMINFRKVCDMELDGITYFTSKDIEFFKKGDFVRVAGGPFEGVEGYLTRIHKDRCVVVVVDGLAAVATTFVHPSMLEKVE